MPGLTPAVVLGSSYVPHTKLGAARSLGRLGVPVYVMERKGVYAPVFFSRYCVQGSITSGNSSSDLLVNLLKLSRKLDHRSVLIPTSEYTANFIAENQTALKDGFIFPVVTPKLVRELSNKKDLYYKAKKYGIPTPTTLFPGLGPNC